ncbi:hypothetical protein GCM10009016_02690 [Halomonas beimenensis]
MWGLGHGASPTAKHQGCRILSRRREKDQSPGASGANALFVALPLSLPLGIPENGQPGESARTLVQKQYMLNTKYNEKRIQVVIPPRASFEPGGRAANDGEPLWDIAHGSRDTASAAKASCPSTS